MFIIIFCFWEGEAMEIAFITVFKANWEYYFMCDMDSPRKLFGDAELVFAVQHESESGEEALEGARQKAKIQAEKLGIDLDFS